MKKVMILLLYCIVSIVALNACGQHEHSYVEADCVNAAVCSECGETISGALGHTTTVGFCERCGEIQNEKLVDLLSANFAEIMDAGNELIVCVTNISELSSEEQYVQFQKADQYAAVMKNLYGDVIDSCSTETALDGLVYQVTLLQNACPNRVEGMDTTSLANQTLLYQLYLQQIYSSFSYLSEYMNWLEGNGDMPSGENYYKEAPNMPTPDSVIYGITYDSEKTNSGAKQYMYLIGENESDANMNYNIYLLALGLCDELEVKIEDTYAHVTENGRMISAMMAGTDDGTEYFLIVSFQA